MARVTRSNARNWLSGSVSVWTACPERWRYIGGGESGVNSRNPRIFRAFAEPICLISHPPTAAFIGCPGRGQSSGCSVPHSGEL